MMIKKIATGLLAAAAATALAATVPAAASATTAVAATTTPPVYHDDWGAVWSKNGLAKSFGHVKVDWQDYGDTNSTTVSGRLYDLDPRKYRHGGLCAYVKFQANYFGDASHEWETVYTRKHCGYPGFKWYSFQEDDVRALRVKVCQTDKHGQYVTKCTKHWQYVYSYEQM
ncbi:hypothetical protein [Nonomuraea sp. NPDC050310]|uniref:hypothetical protein n=1 Tax=unclassified Nonomuraea TaxID=2593643 RepID=UPI0033F909AF